MGIYSPPLRNSPRRLSLPSTTTSGKLPSPHLARHTSRKYFLASTNPFHQLKRTVSCCFVVDFPEPARKYPGECFSSRYRWLTYSVRSETWGGQQEHKSCAYLYVVPGISIPLQLQSREAGSGWEETEGTNVKGSPLGAMKRGR